MLIKARRAKNSARGLYLQDRQLSDTVFKPGTHYKYTIDIKKRQVVILSSEEKGNIVSRRQHSGYIKPVLDIRNKRALQAFQGCEFLQVEIYEDKIVVSGYEETALSRSSMSNQRTTSCLVVTDITQLLKVKKKAEIVLSKQELDTAVGEYEQLTFSFDDYIHHPAKTAALSYIGKALSYLHIPLQLDSLFSGAGMMDLGFIKEGFDVLFAVENNPDAVRTYRTNIGPHIHQADMTKIDKRRFTAPVMIGGSPCQGFSNANRHSNFLDNPNNKLVRAYIDAVKANKNCKVFCLENVPQILTAGNGRFLDEILEELRDFHVEYGILNAADFGAPQGRKRAAFIGSKIGRIELPKPTHLKPVTVREAFAGITDRLANQRDVSKTKDITMERIQSVPPGGNVHDIPESIRPKGNHSDMYKRLTWDKPAVTIIHPRKSMLLHPERNRILSIRECARLQGLDDKFIFKGNLHSMQQQVANGVPIQLAKALGAVIRQAIEKFNMRLRKQPAF